MLAILLTAADALVIRQPSLPQNLLIPLVDFALGFAPTTLSASQAALLHRINNRDLLDPYARVVIQLLPGNNTQASSNQLLRFLKGHLVHEGAAPQPIAVTTSASLSEGMRAGALVVEVQLGKKQLQLVASRERRLESSSNGQTGYIIYFFFIVFFGLAATLTICGIANYEYPKDSLLYAKFIAEVGR